MDNKSDNEDKNGRGDESVSDTDSSPVPGGITEWMTFVYYLNETLKDSGLGGIEGLIEWIIQFLMQLL